jgi:pyrophosphate--fructose-6-phosphate 1-phosphotransferase
VLIRDGKTGYMASMRNLSKGVENWEAGGVPITMLFNMESRHGKLKPVIQKALVDLKGPAFGELARHRGAWEIEDAYLYPGPIQYFGPADICDAITKTLSLEMG